MFFFFFFSLFVLLPFAPLPVHVGAHNSVRHFCAILQSVSLVAPCWLVPQALHIMRQARQTNLKHNATMV